MRGGLCFSGWVRRQITRHRKEMTAAWRRGCSLERAKGPCSPGRETGHLMRTWAWRAGGVAPPPPPGPARAHGCGDAARDRSPRLVRDHNRGPTPRDGPDALCGAGDRGQLPALVRAGPDQTSARHALTVVRATPVSRPGQLLGHWTRWASSWTLSLATQSQQGLGKQRHLENEATCLFGLLILASMALR